MSDDRINAKLSQEGLDSIHDLIRQIRAKIPFATSLNENDKSSLLRLSDRNRSFIRKMLETLTQHPDVSPPRFNLEEFRNNVEAHFQIYSIRQELKLLDETLEDTYRLTGSDALVTALAEYKFLKASNEVTGELDAELEELGKMFVKKAPVVEPAKS